MEEKKDDIVEIQSISITESQERAVYDIQIMTAHKYPRNVKRAMENSIAIVSASKEAAQTCSYALPRAGINITGASVHLARILAQNYGNIRVESKVKEITPTQVVSESTCLDLENNYGVRVEVRRSIIGKAGRFNDDLITVTGNACNAIAYRNAVLAVIPKPIIDAVYQAAQNTLAGDLSTEQKITLKRKEIFDIFFEQYGAKEEDVLKLCGKGALPGVKRDEIVFLIGLLQALKDGDATVDEVFGRNTAVQKTADKLKDLAQKGNETLADQRKKHQEQQQSQTGEPPKRQGRPPKQQDGLFNEQK
jgi:hypothetical protein